MAMMSVARSSSTRDFHRGAITVIAIDKDKNSQFAVKWAVENMILKTYDQCVLIHVRCKSLHPQDVQSVPKEGRPPTEEELQQFFLPYRGFCARKGVLTKEVVLHDIDVPSALVDYVSEHSVANLVVGASNRSPFIWKFTGSDLASTLMKTVPKTCALYVISKGKVQSYRAATGSQKPTPNAHNHQKHASCDWKPPTHPSLAESIDGTSSWSSASSSRSGGSERLVSERSNVFNQKANHALQKSKGGRPTPPQSVSSHSSSSRDSSEPCSICSNSISPENISFASEASSRRLSQAGFDFDNEIRRLKLELQEQMDNYHQACVEAAKTKEKIKDFHGGKVDHGAVMALAEIERTKTRAALEAAQVAERMAHLETEKRIIAEMKAENEEREKNKAMNSLSHLRLPYRRYTIEDIETATDYFADSHKIGEGGYGPVYKAKLDHTSVAIKVLRPDVSQGLEQFRKEVEILSMMRHPNMVILLGACPEYGCLVYEYMENGSLEDRLFMKNGTPPLSWRTRFRIAAEIATALLFLHQTKPEPLVHRDLKPGNILLDRNCVSKIGDVGLARLVPPSVADRVTEYHMTAAAGTFYYIDPEYQQTGMLGVKSDLYSFGVMMLQIITGRPPIGLSHQIGQAIENGTFREMLDPAIPDWPVNAAQLFAELALQCCEMRKRDRPDLAKVVLPQLIKFRDLGTDEHSEYSQKIPYTPQEGMDLPYMEIQRRSVTEIDDGYI